jgi:hypothetical protein
MLFLEVSRQTSSEPLALCIDLGVLMLEEGGVSVAFDAEIRGSVAEQGHDPQQGSEILIVGWL